MNLRLALARAAYRALKPSASLASMCLPPALHPGSRARRSLACDGAAVDRVGKEFAAAMLLARLRSAFLQHHVRSLRRNDLDAFLDCAIRFEGAISLETLLAWRRPVIFATPHFGSCAIGCLGAIRRLGGQRSLHIYYQADARNAAVAALCTRAGAGAETLLSGFAGAARALRVLQRGGFVALMPDVFQQLADTVAVPFFGRLLRVAGGTAFLALRTDALIVPTYITPERELGVQVCFGKPIDPRGLAAGDERQQRFALSCRLFKDLEHQLRRTPEHWLFWETFSKVSTPLDLPRRGGVPDWESALAVKCRQSPALLHRVPQLAAVLRS